MSSTLVSSAVPVTLSLLETLLNEQAQLTAVDKFSAYHEEGNFEKDPRVYKSLLPATSPKPGQQYAFEVDLDTCSGCKACVVACHNLNGLEADETWRKVGTLANAHSQLPVVQYVSTACHHCEDPGCLKGCPVKAYEKDEVTGIVRHLDDQCFGCQYCTMMCPYEVPQYSPTLGIVRKCDMCSQRLNRGESPACVQACPNNAIRITLVESEALRATPNEPMKTLVSNSPPNHWTKPSTRYITKQTYASRLDSVESQSDELSHPHMPLVWMLVLTQGSVGMWFNIALRSLSAQEWNNSLIAQSVTATLTGVVGVHAALLHLGRPKLAYRAFLGWRTSWLSREAILFGVYMALCAATCAVAYLNNSSLDTLKTLACATAAVGLVAVGCSAKIYIATRRALWNSSRTFTDFFGTSLALGLALSCATIAAIDRANGTLLVLACLASLVSILPKLADWYRSYQRDRSAGASQKKFDVRQNFSARSGRLIRKKLQSQWLVMVLLFLAASVSAIAGLFSPSLFASSIVATGLLIVHLISRALYFSTIITYRMPGASS